MYTIPFITTITFSDTENTFSNISNNPNKSNYIINSFNPSENSGILLVYNLGTIWYNVPDNSVIASQNILTSAPNTTEKLINIGNISYNSNNNLYTITINTSGALLNTLIPQNRPTINTSIEYNVVNTILPNREKINDVNNLKQSSTDNYYYQINSILIPINNTPNEIITYNVLDGIQQRFLVNSIVKNIPQSQIQNCNNYPTLGYTSVEVFFNYQDNDSTIINYLKYKQIPTTFYAEIPQTIYYTDSDGNDNVYIDFNIFMNSTGIPNSPIDISGFYVINPTGYTIPIYPNSPNSTNKGNTTIIPIISTTILTGASNTIPGGKKPTTSININSIPPINTLSP